jgi:uncharacterized membrane protein YphA (DoxX/SURF4 family)
VAAEFSDGATDRSRLDVVGTLVRLGLAAVWLTSGAIKASDPNQTWAAVHAYQLLPDPVVEVVAGVLPWFELTLGVLLLLGLGLRHVAVVSGLLLVAFMVGVGQAWARGLSIDCGCFGGGGAVAPGQTSYGTELLRDTGFLVLAIWLIIRPSTLIALENVLTGREEDPLPSGGGS